MSRPVRSIAPDRSLLEALDLMAQARVRRLPVLHGSRRLVGILTLSDVHAALGAPGYRGRPGRRRVALRVRDSMSSRPFTVEPDETIERAALLMLDRKISGLPVVSRGRLVGIITESDLFRALVKILGFESRGARIAFDFGARRDVLEELARRLSRVRLVGLISYLDIPRARHRVVARVAARK